jgi:hypothetical protein
VFWELAESLLRHCGAPTLKGRLTLAALGRLKHPRTGRMLSVKPQYIWAGGLPSVGEECENEDESE